MWVQNSNERACLLARQTHPMGQERRRSTIMTREITGLPYAAANGLLDRRLFMRTLLLVSAGAGASMAFANPVNHEQPEWLRKPGASAAEYGQPSRFEQARTQRLVSGIGGGRSLAAGARTPLHLLHGTITPGGLHFEVNHHG